MKRLMHINEYLIKKKVDKVRNAYEYFPQTNKELQTIVKQLIKEGKTDLNCIDVSKVTNFSWVFNEIKEDFNISGWDVSNATNMNCMFYKCEKFKGEGLENWDVSKVEDMKCMFLDCFSLDCKLSRWNVGNVIYMAKMFSGCKKFKGEGLENWDVSNVLNMNYMFFDCENFEGKGLEKWDVSNVTDMDNMFNCCKNLDVDLENWNIDRVKNMRALFNHCYKMKNKLPTWYKK